MNIDTIAEAMALAANGGKWEDGWYCEDHKKLWRTRAEAAVKALDEAGYVIVPKEPTAETIEAGWGRIDEEMGSGDFVAGAVYRAMLAARPK